MKTLVRAVVVCVIALVAAAIAAGVASAQEPEPTPADQAAQLACLQQYIDFAQLPQQAVADPAAFSALVADAATKCENVTAPVPAPAPAAPAVTAPTG
ncbi:hypothetical protein WIS52_02910 [Pseudonocardia nematodicida]|uniref:Uncharacterized protein n=1 Tax=Pseudonocardia nematodicida TaxID=1206997 RepID=A0ABV1K5M7_9PSEU